MTPDPFFYVRPEERVLLRLRAAPTYGIALALAPALGVTVLLALALVARAYVPAARDIPAWAPWAGWAALLLLVALAAWRRAATTEYVLTDERVYARVGRLVTRLHFTTHDKITDIRYHQGPVERLFGIATMSFATAGADLQVSGIRETMQLKAASEQARDAFVRTLLREAPAAAPEREVAPAAPAPSAPVAERPLPRAPAWAGPRPDYLQAGDTPVWFAQPRPIAAIGALRSLLALIPVLFFTATMPSPTRALVVSAALGFVLLSVALRVAQLRRTEYVATDRRVYGRRGIVGTTVSQLTYDKITDITFQQDLVGKIFGFGTVTVQTAGSNQAPITMIGLDKPLAAKETIERWRDASVGARA